MDKKIELSIQNDDFECIMDLDFDELREKYIDQIIAYWFNSTEEYLLGMGASKKFMPPESELRRRLETQISAPIEEKSAYALVWKYGNKAIGHNNLSDIKYGKQAKMHLHIWYSEYRKMGIGTKLLALTIPHFFKKMKLEKLICEPYADNVAPNKTLEKFGFTLEKEYFTIPGHLNFEQKVKRWILYKEHLNTQI